MSKSDRARVPIIPVILAALFVLIVWGLNFFLLHTLSAQERGTYGDMFGAANSIFSGLAFAGVVYAIFLQRNEISVAREELGYTKTILDETRGQLNRQNDATAIQLFENTFFQLLRILVDITENLDLIDNQNNNTTGKDVITAFEKRLNRVAKQVTTEGNVPTHANVYARLYDQVQNDLGHYFRTLYTMLVFVENSNVPDKKFYSNILRAQLSNSELHLLLYNGISEHGREKLKPLLEKYEFLDNLPLEQVRFKDALKEYNEKAFGMNYEIKNHVLKEIGL